MYITTRRVLALVVQLPARPAAVDDLVGHHVLRARN